MYFVFDIYVFSIYIIAFVYYSKYCIFLIGYYRKICNFVKIAYFSLEYLLHNYQKTRDYCFKISFSLYSRGQQARRERLQSLLNYYFLMCLLRLYVTHASIAIRDIRIITRQSTIGL